MIIKFIKGLLILLLLQVGSGCTYIKSLFPDKERDYQFRSEIPDLIIPDDLKPQMQTSKFSPAAPVPLAQNTVQPAPKTAAPVAAAPKPQPRVADKPKTVVDDTPEPHDAPQTVPSGGSVSSLQIDQQQSQAWRLVARALTRQKIEIVERNLDKGYFYVKYDPDEIKPEDHSVWDEIAFLFGEDPSHEQEYRISCLEVTPVSTEVTIQNADGQTLSNRTATHLLKLITDGINMDMSSPEQQQQ